MGGIAMAPEKHLALFYQDREHQRRMMMPFFSECLKQDLKVLYITNDETTRWIDGLFSKLTVSLDKHPKDQQIKAWTAESVYLREGTLNFDSIIRILQREEKRAESEGFEGLSFCLEVTHILLKLYSLSSFRTFMNALNVFLAGNHRILFLYQSSIIEAVSLMQILTAHPYIAVGDEFIKNPYYTAPEKNPAQVFFTYLMQNHEYLETIAVNREKIREITLARDRFEGLWRSATGALDETKGALTSLEQALKEKTASEENFREEAERLLRLSSEQARGLSVMEERHKELVEREQVQNQETQRLQALLSQAEIRDSERTDRVTWLESQNHHLKDELERLEKEKSEAESKFSEFFQGKALEIKSLEESQMKERIEWNEVKRDLEDRVGDLTQQSLREKSRFEEEISAYTRAIDRLETELANQKSLTIESEIERHRLEASLAEQEETLDLRRQEVRSAQETLLKEKEEWAAKIKVLETQLTLGIEEGRRTEKALKEALSEKAAQNDRIEALTLESSMAKTERTDLFRELEQVKALHKAETESRQESERKTGALLAEREQYRSEKERLRREIETVSDRIEALSAELNALEVEKQAWKEERSGYLEKIAQLTEQIERTAQMKDELELFCEDARIRSENSSRELESARQTILELSAQKEGLLQDLENGKAQITSLSAQVEEAKEMAERKRKCLGDLKLRLEQQETSELRLRKELAESNKSLAESRALNEDLNAKELECRDRIEHLKIRLDQEESLFQEVQKEIFSYKAQISILEERLKDEEIRHREKDRFAADLTGLVELLKTENEEVREQYRQIRDLKNRLETLWMAKGLEPGIARKNERLASAYSLGIVSKCAAPDDGEVGDLECSQEEREERDVQVKLLQETVESLQRERSELLSLLEVADDELKKAQRPEEDFLSRD